ncbi:MAG TPA: OmpA family protein, partial [Candidatus Eisenbacteria bacterium]|nr:OmpA family protein [Candidatus Eisenbacteria bacterium]
TRPDRTVKPLASAVALICYCVLDAGSALAEVEVSAVGGQHFFSARNALGRSSPTSPETALKNGAMLGARFAYFPVARFGAELEVGVVPTNTAEGAGITVPAFRAGGIVNLLSGSVRPFLSAGGAVFVASPSDPLKYASEGRAAAMAGTGVRIDVGDWWGLCGSARWFALKGQEGTSIAFDGEWSMAIYGRFPAPPPPEERGRGPLIADEDHDGVGDKLDKCPDRPGPVRNYGCPLDTDRDQDGIADREDKCPDAGGPKDQGGCPDADHDKIVDVEDRCPAQAGIAENHGCPDADRDGDAIVDRLDRCPTEPETKNGIDDEDGCPDETPAPPPPAPTIRNLEAIDFTRGTAALTPASLTVLDTAAAVLLGNPAVNVEIVGHTDRTGNEPNNLRLSRARADAVRAYLIQRGVPEARVTSVGKGSSEPVVAATEEETNRKSRRVEFRFTTATPNP